MATKIETAGCKKCFGTGRLAHYAHVDHGRCFRCGGSGQVRSRTTIVMPAVASASRQSDEGRCPTDAEWAAIGAAVADPVFDAEYLAFLLG
jgi:DnaJ-class molecular chaperone